MPKVRWRAGGCRAAACSRTRGMCAGHPSGARGAGGLGRQPCGACKQSSRRQPTGRARHRCRTWTCRSPPTRSEPSPLPQARTRREPPRASSRHGGKEEGPGGRGGQARGGSARGRGLRHAAAARQVRGEARWCWGWVWVGGWGCRKVTWGARGDVARTGVHGSRETTVHRCADADATPHGRVGLRGRGRSGRGQQQRRHAAADGAADAQERGGAGERRQHGAHGKDMHVAHVSASWPTWGASGKGGQHVWEHQPGWAELSDWLGFSGETCRAGWQVRGTCM